MELTRAQQTYFQENQWTLKTYQAETKLAYRELVVSEYGPDDDIAQPAYIDWQYEQNPAGPAYVLMVMTKDGRAAGAYCVIPIRVQMESTVATAAVSINTITHKEFRGRKIFATLVDIACQQGRQERNISFIYGFPNQNSYHGFVKRFAFTDMGCLPLLLKPCHMGRVLGSKIGIMNNAAVTAMGRLVFPKARPKHKNSLTVRLLDRTDEGFDHLWEKNKHRYTHCVVRDRAFVQWRYFDSPVRKYAVFGALDQDGKLAGYAVVRDKVISKINSCLIGDVFVDQDDEQVFRSLMQAVETYCDKKQLALAGALVPQTGTYFRLFKRAGYFPCPKALEPQPFPMIIRLLEPGPATVKQLDQWHVMMGDYDVF